MEFVKGNALKEMEKRVRRIEEIVENGELPLETQKKIKVVEKVEIEPQVLVKPQDKIKPQDKVKPDKKIAENQP